MHDLYPWKFLEGISYTIHILHDTVAYGATRMKTDEMDYAFDNYHSRRMISSKVETTFLGSLDSKVEDLRKPKL